jgi:hypothetical protein
VTLFPPGVTLLPRHVTLRVTLPAACCPASPYLSNDTVVCVKLASVSLWRRRAALGLLGLWGVVSLARLSRLVGPAEPPPGAELASALDFFRASIPADAGYLFVEPGAFGTDPGDGQRLRYELYPRRYDDVRAAVDEAEVRQLMRAEGLGYVVVPDASPYAPTSWLRQPRDWLRREELDANRYVLVVVA